MEYKSYSHITCPSPTEGAMRPSLIRNVVNVKHHTP